MLCYVNISPSLVKKYTGNFLANDPFLDITLLKLTLKWSHLSSLLCQLCFNKLELYKLVKSITWSKFEE